MASPTRIKLEELGQGGQPNQDKVVPLSVCLSVRAKRGMEYKSVNHKEKEISVLGFVFNLPNTN